MKQYFQCKLRMVRIPGVQTTGWIEGRAAKVGAKVEVLGENSEWWEVTHVGTQLPEDLLKEHQRMHRKSLVSIEPMAPPKVVGGI